VQVGTVIEGTYRLTRRIGEGGMGTVYEASHARLDGRYAVKFLHPDISTRHPGAVARFRREARITSALRHPGIVQVIDFNTPADGPPFLVMEYLDGANLAEVIAREAPFSLARVDDITGQVASALSAAHRKGIVHRDLNPSNIFVVPADGDQPERVKILDFGISKIRSVSKRITGTAQVLGTPQYMAPEQAEGGVKDMDGAADQFSLAAIVYEMLTGRPAFTGDTLAAVAYQVVHAMPEPLSELRGALPPDVETVLLKALAKDKRDRFESISAFAGAFRRAAHPPRPERAGSAVATSKWHEAETVVSPPDFLEKLALERSLGSRPPARPPAEHQQTVVVRRRKRLPLFGLGRHTGEIPHLRPVPPARARTRLVTAALAAAGVGIVALVLTLAVRSRGPRLPPPLPVRAGAPSGPMVQPLRAPTAALDTANGGPGGGPTAADPNRGLDAKAKPNPTPTPKPRARVISAETKPLETPELATARPPRVDTEGLETELGLTAAARPEPAPTGHCSVTLGSSPWADLWIDGSDTGKHTPVVQLAVDCGAHTLEFKRPDLRLEHQAKVVLRPGDEFKERYRLAPSE
jgi:serine/threonine protein kinase